MNWDPVDNTVLANEQVVDGCGWRSGVPVERKTLRQWFLRISDFAEDLLDGLNTLENWPEKVRIMPTTIANISLLKDSRFQCVRTEFLIQNKHVHFKALIRGEKITVGRSQKMSKSKKNVVDPAHIIDAYGADTARLFMLSDSPPERDLEWSDAGVEGAWRYINRLWKIVMRLVAAMPFETVELASIADSALLATRKVTHKTIAAVSEDLDGFHLNKAVARIREMTNHLEKLPLENPEALSVMREAVEAVVKLLQPMIPHITEELWHQLGHESSLLDEVWPVADMMLAVDNTVTLAIQVNGKMRATIDVAKDEAKETVEKIALSEPKLQSFLEGKTIRKVIIIPNRIVNVVAA